MKLAYILAVYKNKEQVIRLYEKINSDNAVFVIHICKNANSFFVKSLKKYFKDKKNIYFCKRERATVLRYGIVDAVMNAIETLIKNNVSFDYLTSLSGQDYPIKPVEAYNNFLVENYGKQFIRFHPLDITDEAYKNTVWKRKENYRYEKYWIKFTKKGKLYNFPVSRFIDKPFWNVLKIYLYELPQYIKEKRFFIETIEFIFSRIYYKKKKILKGYDLYGGWAWWTFTYDCAKYLLETYRKNPQIKIFFKYSWTPDEMVYQTIIMNSHFKNNVINDDLREIEFPEGRKDGSHPHIFTAGDFQKLKSSKQFFARKFDLKTDEKIFELIDKELL